MKKTYIAPLLVVATLALFVPSQIHAATPSPKPKPTHTTIASIDANSITVKEANGTKTYTINSQTEIDYKGGSAKVTDLKPGMRVSVTAAADPTVADRISANDPPKDSK